MRNDGQGTRRIQYTVTVRGVIPADIGARVSAAHAHAIKNRGYGGGDACGNESASATVKDRPARLEEGGL